MSATGLQQSLPARYYLSDDVFAAERERILFAEWFCVGRDEDIPCAGDYVVRDVVGESVLLVRTKQGEARAFYNVCRHRGCRLVLGDDDSPPSGRFRGSIRCPYHSWTYGLEGELRGAPFLGASGDFDRTPFSLVPVEIASWAGFLFVCLSRPPPSASLAERLREISERLTRYPLERLATARAITYSVRANWKVIAENYNECYHCAGVHPELCRLVPAFKQAGGAGLDWDDGVPHRDGAYTFTTSGTTARAPFAGLNELERTRHKAELVYPNLMLSLSPDHVAAFCLWPRGPGLTEIECRFLFEPKEIQRRDFDPSDAVDLWDLVNRQDWRVCEGVQAGMSSRAFGSGWFAPMENPSLDIRSYVLERLGGGLPDAR